MVKSKSSFSLSSFSSTSLYLHAGMSDAALQDTSRMIVFSLGVPLWNRMR